MVCPTPWLVAYYLQTLELLQNFKGNVIFPSYVLFMTHKFK